LPRHVSPGEGAGVDSLATSTISGYWDHPNECGWDIYYKESPLLI
jgi:hypothetical protein